MPVAPVAALSIQLEKHTLPFLRSGECLLLGLRGGSLDGWWLLSGVVEWDHQPHDRERHDVAKPFTLVSQSSQFPSRLPSQAECTRVFPSHGIEWRTASLTIFMPAALDRLLCCPATLRTLLVQSYRAAPPFRAYSSHADRPKIRQDASLEEEAGKFEGGEVSTVSDLDPLLKVSSREQISSKPSSSLESTYAPSRLLGWSKGEQTQRVEVNAPLEKEGDKSQATRDSSPSLLSSLGNSAHSRTVETLHSTAAAEWVEQFYEMKAYRNSKKRRRHFQHAIVNGIQIPAWDSPGADIIWRTLLKCDRLHLPVLKYAVDIHDIRGEGITPSLYQEFMEFWLPREAELGLGIHEYLVEEGGLKELPLRQIARLVKGSLSNSGLAALLEIYRSSGERDLYDEMIPALLERGETRLAYWWHAACEAQEDYPSPAIASQPKVQALGQGVKTIPLLQLMRLASERRYKPDLDEELLRRFEGRSTASVRFDDAFCARLFATKSFSPASVIKGLAMAGVNEIGPQAVRAMAIRTDQLSADALGREMLMTDPIYGLSDCFQELRESGITLQSSTFSLALEKFALEEKHSLARSIMYSDQHPDVFDDVEQQRTLLSYYLNEQDWVQAHRTLAILSLFHKDSTSESWNIMLRHHVKRIDRKGVEDTLEYMGRYGIFVSVETMATLRNLLRPRRRGRRPMQTSNDDIDTITFLARCYIKILQSGIGFVYPVAWKELIKRLGMLGRLREMKRLLFWLASWYNPRGPQLFATVPFKDAANLQPSQLYHDDRAAYREVFEDAPRALFPSSLQQAIIVWGFRAGLLPNATLEQNMLPPPYDKKHHRKKHRSRGALAPLHWSYGLRMLVELRDCGAGIKVHPMVVRKALSMVFASLFAPGHSLNKANRIMEANNTKPLSEYVKEVNDIWGSPLFKLDGIAGEGAPSQTPLLIRKHMAALGREEWKRRGEPMVPPAKQSSEMV